MPRIEGRAESERVVSDCERAYYAAAALEAALPHPFVLRSLTAADAAAQWLDVAVDCPSRFGEGVTNAARLISRYAAGDTDDTALIAATDVWSSLTGDASGTAEPADSSASASDDDTAAASDAGESPSDADASADTTDTITGMPTASLAAMALAEDRAGFILQIMAARGDGGVTLTMSDAHHAAGERLFSLSALADTDDPRLKTYDASALLDHPSTLIDPATGLNAPALAVVEMNCAREEIAAVEPSDDTGNESDDESATAGTATGGSGAAGTAADGSGAAASPSADTARTMRRALADLIAARLRLAFAHGYPMFDEALFV